MIPVGERQDCRFYQQQLVLLNLRKEKLTIINIVKVGVRIIWVIYDEGPSQAVAVLGG